MKKLVIFLDIQQIYYFVVTGLIIGACSYIKVPMNVTHLKAISNVRIPPHSIATIQTKRTVKCITNTTCIFEVEID